MENYAPVEISEYNIEIYSKMQKLVYRCLSMFGPSVPVKNINAKQELLDIWGKKLFENMDYRITFDESVWTPIDPTAYGNIAVLHVRYLSMDIHVVHIDFREPWHPIFNIEYKCQEQIF